MKSLQSNCILVTAFSRCLPLQQHISLGRKSAGMALLLLLLQLLQLQRQSSFIQERRCNGLAQRLAKREATHSLWDAFEMILGGFAVLPGSAYFVLLFMHN